jgi:membrane protein
LLRGIAVLREIFSKQFLKDVWKRANDDDIFGRSAQLSFYFLLAIFPLLLFLLTIFGYFYGAGSLLRDELISYLRTIVPSSALQLVVSTIDEVSASRGGGKLSFGFLASLWAASNGMIAIAEALNVAYDVRETRTWWKLRLVAIALTIALAFLIISALMLILYGGNIGEALAGRAGFSAAFVAVWKILQLPIALVFVIVGFHLLYHFAPNLAAANARKKVSKKDYRRRLFSPGTLIAVILWLIVSLGFRLYLHFFDSYSATYGSLGALIILMLWFYLTGAAILLGGEINCECDSRRKAS